MVASLQCAYRRSEYDKALRVPRRDSHRVGDVIDIRTLLSAGRVDRGRRGCYNPGGVVHLARRDGMAHPRPPPQTPSPPAAAMARKPTQDHHQKRKGIKTS